MFAPLIITGNVIAKSESVELVKAELFKLIEITRQEHGCIQYTLHQDNMDHAKFLFYEQWQNRELWQVHMHADHIQAFLMATDGHIAEFTVNEMTIIG